MWDWMSLNWCLFSSYVLIAVSLPFLKCLSYLKLLQVTLFSIYCSSCNSNTTRVQDCATISIYWALYFKTVYYKYMKAMGECKTVYYMYMKAAMGECKTQFTTSTWKQLVNAKLLIQVHESNGWMQKGYNYVLLKKEAHIVLLHSPCNV